MIILNGRTFELLHEHRNGWNPDAFKERYSDVLDRYDFIVGDWGYNQLRLRGFFREGSSKSTKDSAFSAIQDYLHEYCNFGCSFFVLERTYGKGGLNSSANETTAINLGRNLNEEEEWQPSPDGSAPVPSSRNGKPTYLWRENQSPQRQANRQQASSAAANETEQLIDNGKSTSNSSQNGRKFNKGQANHNHPRSSRPERETSRDRQ